MALTEKQRAARRRRIERLVARRERRDAQPLPDEVSDPTVEVVTPDQELEQLPDPD